MKNWKELMKGAGLSEQQSDDVIYAIRRESFNDGKSIGWDYATWKTAEVVRDRMLATENESVYAELLSCYREISGMFRRYEEFANEVPNGKTTVRRDNNRGE